MSSTIEEMISGFIRIFIIGMALIAFITLTLYFIAVNNTKLVLGKALDEIEDRMDKVGYIERSYVEETLVKYLDGEAIIGYDTYASPGFNVVPDYLGQPMYIEVVVDCEVAGMEFTITERADAYNRGYYGNGYNTPSEH